MAGTNILNRSLGTKITLNTAQQGSGGWSIVVKVNDTSKTNDDTLAADPDLVIPVVVNGKYIFQMFTYIKSPVGSGFKHDFAIPSGTTGWKNDSGAFWSGGISPYDTVVLTTTDTVNVDDNTPVNIASFHGYISVGSTAGNVTLRWAQSISNGVATILKQGTYISYRKIN